MNIYIQTSRKFGKHNELHYRGLDKYLRIKNNNQPSLHFVSDSFGGEEYPSNVTKTLSAMILAQQEPDEWSVHMDHDTWVDMKMVETYVNQKADYKAFHCKLNKDGSYSLDPDHIYPSGPLMILSPYVRQILIPELFKCPNYCKHLVALPGFSDVIIGYILNRIGISIVEFPFNFDHYQTENDLRTKYHL